MLRCFGASVLRCFGAPVREQARMPLTDLPKHRAAPAATEIPSSLAPFAASRKAILGGMKNFTLPRRRGQPTHARMKFLSRLLSVTAITFAHGRCHAVRGKVGHRQLEALGACLAEAGVGRAEIWIAGNGRVKFSREIGPVLHQRLRNIMHA